MLEKVTFFCFRPDIPWANQVQKIKIVTLSLNFVPRQTWTNIIQWCSIFPFSTGNVLFGKIWFKKSKLLVYAEIWYLQSFTKYSRQTLVFMWNSALREKFNFSFLRNFYYHWQNSHLAIGNISMKLLDFPDIY